ncbi:putative DNA ligase-like protein [Lysinibacillus sphaericus OT4b.31]|uniref:Putative DNA ligase-like protein n=1 Tax=Lysinibacillus sphaericus OT4b.31 TaxID=1285586 RepID=R7Z9N8_LYSSH|nr:putative DNA ligase-like protein [Lysinibacillus sphaericus OT4b.31]
MIWLESKLYCKVQYLERTNTGMLKIVSFKGFNFDKVPEEVNK